MRFPSRYRIVAYVVAWAGALFATDPTLQLWPLVYMFPLGLAAFFIPPEHRGSPGWLVLGIVFVGYVIQAVTFFRARSGYIALVLLIILVAALTCNVTGCREMNHTH